MTLGRETEPYDSLRRRTTLGGKLEEVIWGSPTEIPRAQPIFLLQTLVPQKIGPISAAPALALAGSDC